MKNLSILLIIFLFGIFACIRVKKESHSLTIYNQTESKMFPYIISNGKLGTISVGDRIDSTLKNLETLFIIKNDSIPSCEGCTTYTSVIQVRSKESNKILFSIEPGVEENNRDKIFRMTTSCDLFQTDKSIKIGMTVKAVKQKYEILNVDSGGETGLHIIIKDFSGSFGIEIPNDDNWWFYKPSSIPDSLRITEIIIT